MTIVVGSGGVTTLTGADLIKKAMRILGALGRGEEPLADDLADGLVSLNMLLDAWWTDRSMVYRIQEVVFNWTGGQQTMTIGSGGQVDTTRPVKVLDSFSRIGSVDRAFASVPKNVYDAIRYKPTQASYLELVYYDDANPIGTLSGWPIPSTTLEVHLNTYMQLLSFANVTDTVTLPPGYARCLCYNLAAELEPESGLILPDAARRIAGISLAEIQKINLPSLTASTETAALLNRYGRRSNIYADGP